MPVAHDVASQLDAVAGIERDLPGDAAHLLAQDCGLPGGIVRLVVASRSVELFLSAWSVVSLAMATCSGSSGSRRMPALAASSSRPVSHLGQQRGVDASAAAERDQSSVVVSAGRVLRRIGRRQDALGEPPILVVARLLRPDRRHAGDHDDLVARRELHDLARREQRPRRLLPRDHEVAEPGRQPVPGIVLHRAHFGRGAERIRDALGRALVVGGEGDADMAVVEDRVVRAVGLLDLVERLRDQESS